MILSFVDVDDIFYFIYLSLNLALRSSSDYRHAVAEVSVETEGALAVAEAGECWVQL